MVFEVLNGLKKKNPYRDIFLEKTIKSHVKQKTEERTFNIQITDNLVPFEVIDLTLQKKVPEIIDKNKLNLILYLPLIAFL